MVKRGEFEKGTVLYYYDENSKRIDHGAVFDTTSGEDFFSIHLIGHGNILCDLLFLSEEECIVYMNDTFNLGIEKAKQRLKWNRSHLKAIKKIAAEKGIELK